MTQVTPVSQVSSPLMSTVPSTRKHPAVYAISTHTAGSDDEYLTGWAVEQRSLAQAAVSMARAWWSPHVFSQGKREQVGWLYADWLTLEWHVSEFPLSNLRMATKSLSRILVTSLTKSVILALPLHDRCTDLAHYRAIRERFLRDVPVEKAGFVPRFYAPADGVEVSTGPRFDWRRVLGV